MLMLSAEGGTGGGGGTLKAQLEKAESERDIQKGRADKAETDLKAEQESHGTTKTQLKTAETDRDTFKARAEKAEGDLKTEQEDHNKLKGEQKNVTQRAAEQLAKNGVKPAAKDTPENLNPDAADPVALWEEYSAADSTEQAKMRAKHGDKLTAAAAAYDTAQKQRR